MLLDVRNDFEVQMGSFKNAINPKTKNFTEFKDFVKTNLTEHKDKKIAMFCTGGIRCEKASSYLIAKGFRNVCQLDGGILKYLENTPHTKSLWKGECFVFDGRVSLKNELKMVPTRCVMLVEILLSLKRIKYKKIYIRSFMPKMF